MACGQFGPRVGFQEENREKSLKIIDDAAREKVDLLVLPELCNSGYTFRSKSEARSLCEQFDGKTASLWAEAARRNRMHVVAGLAEKDGAKLYNASLLFGPKGLIGRYRKLHLWNREKLFFQRGNLGLPVFRTAIGNIGMQICYDQWFVETTRILALQKADIVVGPANWDPLNKEEHPRNLQKTGKMPLPDTLAIVNSHVNAVWIAYCDRTGIERGQPFMGSSIICEPSGRIAAGPASPTKEELLIARNCDVFSARRGKQWTKLNKLTEDRRTDVYGAMLGYKQAAAL
jgi:N-carbamoylputrescine amidase